MYISGSLIKWFCFSFHIVCMAWIMKFAASANLFWGIFAKCLLKMIKNINNGHKMQWQYRSWRLPRYRPYTGKNHGDILRKKLHFFQNDHLFCQRGGKKINIFIWFFQCRFCFCMWLRLDEQGGNMNISSLL